MITVTARPVGDQALGIIKMFEGCAKKRPDGKFDAYPDPATGSDPWTIGWGSTGPDIHAGLVWTQDQCDGRLIEDAQRFANAVQTMVGDSPITRGQFDAMTSFAYNVGASNLRSSTLLKKHLSGDYAGAQAEFAKWNKAGGKVMAGLTRRRDAEAELYGS